MSVDGGKTFTFKIRTDIKFHDGTPLTAKDVLASFSRIVDPPQGISSARKAHFSMVDSLTAPDDQTVVFKLKYPSGAFLPALATPYNFIYSKAKLDTDPRWYEQNVMGSGPFIFDVREAGARITGTLLNALDWHDKTIGLETMCVGGGQGMAMVLERLN